MNCESRIFSDGLGTRRRLECLSAGAFPSTRAEGQVIEPIIGLVFWYPFLQSFFTVHFPDQTELQIGEDLVNSIEVLADKGTVICSVKGNEFKRVEMPKEPMLSNWQKEKPPTVAPRKQVLEIVAPKQSDPDQKEWTWNHNQYGYEGVHLYGGEVLWYDHRHNPHGGGAAREQSFEEFLEQGPACALPGEYYQELYQAVKRLARKGKRKQRGSP